MNYELFYRREGYLNYEIVGFDVTNYFIAAIPCAVEPQYFAVLYKR